MDRIGTPTLPDLLVSRGLLASADLDRLGGRAVGTLALMDRLVALGILAEEQIARALADEAGCPYVTIDLAQVDPALVRRVPGERLRQARALPLIDDGDAIDVAFADPTDGRTVATLAGSLNRPVRPAAATSTAIHAALRDVFGSVGVDAAEPIDEASGTLRLYGHLLACVKEGASDLLLAPDRDGGAVRWRRDGRLHEVERLRSAEHAALIARLGSLLGLRSEVGGRRSATLRSDVAGQALWLTVELVRTAAGEAARVHLEPVLSASTPWPGDVGPDLRARLAGFLSGGEGLMVVNDPRPERAAALVDGLLRETDSIADQRVSVGRAPSPALEGAVALDVEAFGGDLGAAVRAAVALDADVLVVRLSPGEPPPREALVGLRPGRRVVLLATWNDAVEAVLGLRQAGLPAGSVETQIRWIVTLGAGPGGARSVAVPLCTSDAPALARAVTPDALRALLSKRI